MHTVVGSAWVCDSMELVLQSLFGPWGNTPYGNKTNHRQVLRRCRGWYCTPSFCLVLNSSSLSPIPNSHLVTQWRSNPFEPSTWARHRLHCEKDLMKKGCTGCANYNTWNAKKKKRNWFVQVNFNHDLNYHAGSLDLSNQCYLYFAFIFFKLFSPETSPWISIQNHYNI